MAISTLKGRKRSSTSDQTYMMLSPRHFEIHGRMSLEDVLNLTFSAQLHFMKQALSNVPEPNRDDAKGYFYDMFNKSASKLLELFAPELEVHPDLTAEAILRAENAILDEFKAANPDLPEVKPAIQRAQREIDEIAARHQMTIDELEAENVRKEAELPQSEPVPDLPSEPFG